MKPDRPSTATAPVPQLTGRTRKVTTRSAVIEALKNMSIPIARDPDIDPEFYEITDLFHQLFGPLLAETAELLEANSKDGGGDV
ncbi:hypothetical protein [Variovorax sp. dw_308]|uniref:hypothetical protein n=1 Tax=Variovorax sp. dw_308 TaxID=2721546 RepID=UPI001C45BA48|nr:hypothetical protein [Variovorax sp. dw_308]